MDGNDVFPAVDTSYFSKVHLYPLNNRNANPPHACLYTIYVPHFSIYAVKQIFFHKLNQFSSLAFID